MSDIRSPRTFSEAIANLKLLADKDGVVTSPQIDAAFGSLNLDMDELDRALERNGLIWNDPLPGRPEFPPGYVGLRIVRTALD